MSWLEKMRQQKLLSVSLLLFTLSIGILIGTLMNTGVLADKNQVAKDATPLAIPSPVQVASEFTKLAKQMEPTVVNITTDYAAPRAQAQRRRRPQTEEEGEEQVPDLFRRFFRGPFGESGPRMMPRLEATGSGFIVDPKGYIITNHHVVDGADHIKVRLMGDQTEYKGKLIGSDVETDLAVIKIDAAGALPTAKIANSDSVQVGDWAVAIGSPFGLETSVTAGIVSAKGREVGQQFQSFIQTDAAINPGNSGGPLLNIRGEVVGVNTAIATQTGSYNGIGFALPMNTAVKVYNQIIKYGRVTRGSIGVSWNKGDTRPELMKALGTDHGVMVQSVTAGGPSDKAGIKPEDIIVSMDGKKVKDGDDLVQRVADTPLGNKVTITVDRGGRKMDLAVVVADRSEVFKDDPRFASSRRPEEPPRGEVTQARFGMLVRNLQVSEREEMKIEGERGVIITRVENDSFAEEVGLQERDVVLSINRQPVGSVDDLKKIQTTLKPGDAVAFRVMRASLAVVGGARDLRPQFRTFYLAGTLPATQ